MAEINSSIPLQSVVPQQEDMLSKAAKVFSMSEMVKQGQRQDQELALKKQELGQRDQIERTKAKLQVMGGQAAMIFNRDRELQAQGLSPAARQAEINDLYNRGKGALAGARYPDGTPMFSEQELAQLPEQADMGQIGQTLSQLIGADKMLDMAHQRISEQQSAAQLTETTRHNKAMEPKAAGGAGAAGTTYDPETIKTAAMVVASDPTRMRDYASFGTAGQAARIEINNAITQLKKNTGMSDADFIKARTNARAAAASVQKMTAQQNGIQAFEGLAKANGQRLLDLFEKVDDTGVPVIEGITRAAKRSGGNVDAAELQSVLTTYQTEVARILGNPNMTGVISDSARHEVQQMASGKMSVAQAKRVINRINVEMDLRNQFLGEQIDKAGSATVVGGAPAQAAPAASAPSGGKVVRFEDLP